MKEILGIDESMLKYITVLSGIGIVKMILDEKGSDQGLKELGTIANYVNSMDDGFPIEGGIEVWDSLLSKASKRFE